MLQEGASTPASFTSSACTTSAAQQASEVEPEGREEGAETESGVDGRV